MSSSSIAARVLQQSDSGSNDDVIGALAFMVFVFVMVCFFVCTIQVCIRLITCLRAQPPLPDPPQLPEQPSNNNAGSGEPAIPYDESSLARRANLAPCLLLSERIQILECIFKRRVSEYKPPSAESSKDKEEDAAENDEATDVEVGSNSPTTAATDAPPGENASVTFGDSTNDSDAKGKDKGKDPPASTAADSIVATAMGLIRSSSKSQPAPSDSAPDTENNENADYNHTMCSICLTEFDTGDESGGTTDRKLISGTSCPHLFHYDCCMQWLRQHDHCPYCRADMVTVGEFTKAANEVLGADRVLQLTMTDTRP